MIRVKRAYEPPARGDGKRVLVERLWPRGMKKEELVADAWLKDVAPSTALRKWFGHVPERWEEFRRRYRAELDANPVAWQPLMEASRRGSVTLLFSAHDTARNSAVVLREYLDQRADARRRVNEPSARAGTKSAGPTSRDVRHPGRRSADARASAKVTPSAGRRGRSPRPGARRGTRPKPS